MQGLTEQRIHNTSRFFRSLLPHESIEGTRPLYILRRLLFPTHLFRAPLQPKPQRLAPQSLWHRHLPSTPLQFQQPLQTPQLEGKTFFRQLSQQPPAPIQFQGAPLERQLGQVCRLPLEQLGFQQPTIPGQLFTTTYPHSP